MSKVRRPLLGGRGIAGGLGAAREVERPVLDVGRRPRLEAEPAVGPHQEDSDGRAVQRRRSSSPLSQWSYQRRRHAWRSKTASGPKSSAPTWLRPISFGPWIQGPTIRRWASRQAAVRPRARIAGERLEGAAQEDVEPAAQVEDRGIDLVGDLRHGDRRPVRPRPRRGPASPSTSRRAPRSAARRRAAGARSSGPPRRRPARSAGASTRRRAARPESELRGQQAARDPAPREAVGVRAAREEPAALEVAGRLADEEGREVGRAGGGGEVLGAARVRAVEHADPAVRPGLTRRPTRPCRSRPGARPSRRRASE